MLPEEQPDLVIYVDDRESDSGLIELLQRSQLFEVVKRRLDVSDVVVGSLGIERKSGADFVTSVQDGRLFRQLLNLKRCFPQRLLLLEGGAAVTDGLPERSIDGLFTKISCGLQIPILRTRSLDHSGQVILRMAIQQVSKPQHTFSWRSKPLQEDLRYMQQFLLFGIRGLGVEVINALLQRFGSPRAIFNASLDELQEVPGVGPRRAFTIHTIAHGNE